MITLPILTTSLLFTKLRSKRVTWHSPLYLDHLYSNQCSLCCPSCLYLSPPVLHGQGARHYRKTHQTAPFPPPHQVFDREPGPRVTSPNCLPTACVYVKFIKAISLEVHSPFNEVTPLEERHSQKWTISNFPCSLTRNITSHSRKNLAFHSLSRWTMIILPILTTSVMHFSFKGWENILFWTWEWKGYCISCAGTSERALRGRGGGEHSLARGSGDVLPLEIL